MAETIEMLKVYCVGFTHGNCDPHTCDRASRLDGDETFYYTEWTEVSTKLRQFLDGRSRGCVGEGSVSTELMEQAEYDALPDDVVAGEGVDGN